MHTPIGSTFQDRANLYLWIYYFRILYCLITSMILMKIGRMREKERASLMQKTKRKFIIYEYNWTSLKNSFGHCACMHALAQLSAKGWQSESENLQFGLRIPIFPFLWVRICMSAYLILFLMTQPSHRNPSFFDITYLGLKMWQT